jgi:hypothetical protein
MNLNPLRGILICAVLLLGNVSFGFCQILLPEKKGHNEDVVILDNGDRLTGEIKKVQNGILYLKSDRALGTLQLDWERVRILQSTARYEVEDIRGIRSTGTITESAEGRMALKLDDGSHVEIKLLDILEVREMRQRFFGRLNLSLDAGVTFTQGNQQKQFNIDSSLEYTKPLYSLQINLSSLFSGQKDGTSTSRHELVFFPTRHLSQKWRYIGLAGLLHDNQQNLDLRSTLGGGIGRTFMKTNRTSFLGYAGFVYTREIYFPEAGENRSNIEFLTGISISSYKFRSSNLEGYFLVFPSVSNAGRIRADVNVSWKWEIVKDLYWKVSGFDNFDSEPPVATPKNNFGLSSSVGWSF